MKRNSDLAIYGGTPIRSAPMPPRFAIGKEERAEIDEVFRHYDALNIDPGYQGHFEDRYCAAFSEYLGGGYADAVSTGTASLYISLAVLDLPKGSEVLTSCITDPGTLSAIILNGLTPKLVDTQLRSYNVGAEQFADRISDKTRAVIVVHASGQAADIEEIVKEAHARDIRVIEDCSQAHGATFNDKRVGSFGDVAAFSTMYRKAHITGSSGGVVFSRDKDLYHLALAHADRGKPRWSEDFSDQDPSNYLFPALNFHSNEIACAIGYVSLRRLPETIRARLAFVKGLDAMIGKSELCQPIGWREGDSPFFYPIVVDTDRLEGDKIEFARAIAAEGIGLNPHYQYVVSQWPWVQQYLADDFDCPNALSIRDRSFNLFVNEKYSRSEVHDTVDAILKVEQAIL